MQPAGSLVAKTRSLDQARAVVTFLDAASEKTLRSTVALTAARGRGKSAALGLAIAGALALGYSNIFVTAPSPENLRTLFEFVFKVRPGFWLAAGPLGWKRLYRASPLSIPRMLWWFSSSKGPENLEVMVYD